MNMHDKADRRWWAFSLDPDERAHNPALNGDLAINAPTEDGRRQLDYQSYLGLDDLLHCQSPGSKIPDERIFVITHQIFELVFKQMIFDLAVIAAAVSQVMQRAQDADALWGACTEQDAFWLPAQTAAARLTHASKTVIPGLVGYLGKQEGRDETFASSEFGAFRNNLIPASGFQSAQFRLIQRALGKAPLFGVRLFPGDDYWQNYQGTEGGTLPVVDPLVMRRQMEIAQPEAPDSPLLGVAHLDDLLQGLLGRLPALGEDEPLTQGIELVEERQITHLAEIFSKILANRRRMRVGQRESSAAVAAQDAQAVKLFRQDLRQVARQENARRQELQAARSGMLALYARAPQAPLVRIIANVVATDRQFHDEGSEGSFLSRHQKLAIDRLGDLHSAARQRGETSPLNGTGGGGVEYLGFMRKLLLPLFPALVACRHLHGAPAELTGFQA